MGEARRKEKGGRRGRLRKRGQDRAGGGLLRTRVLLVDHSFLLPVNNLGFGSAGLWRPHQKGGAHTPAASLWVGVGDPGRSHRGTCMFAYAFAVSFGCLS